MKFILHDPDQCLLPADQERLRLLLRCSWMDSDIPVRLAVMRLHCQVGHRGLEYACQLRVKRDGDSSMLTAEAVDVSRRKCVARTVAEMKSRLRGESGWWARLRNLLVGYGSPAARRRRAAFAGVRQRAVPGS